MIATESRIPTETVFCPVSAKKTRADSTSSTDSNLVIDSSPVRNLEIEEVKDLFMDYDLLESEDVACVVCGKHYKSRVCVKKHLWEHSVYWDLFDGLKKQQRVLSIQAAIILAIRSNPSLSVLLVTSSSTGAKKKSDKTPSDKVAPVVNQRKRKISCSSGTSVVVQAFVDTSYPSFTSRLCPSQQEEDSDSTATCVEGRMWPQESAASLQFLPLHAVSGDSLFVDRTSTS